MPRIAFILLNPSTADETVEDPTLRRCVGFARAWRFGSLIVVNLFAWRATKPEELRNIADPIGPRNDEFLRTAADEADCSVTAWGAWGVLRERASEVLAMLSARPLYRFGLTRNGQPRHPLYVPASVTLQRV